MSGVVLDSSALLACLRFEPGSELVASALAQALISSVNLAETMSVLVRDGMPPHDARSLLEVQEFEVVDFDRGLAEDAGALIAQTKSFGLSLGDRACLALAARENVPVLTADRAWEGVQAGVTIRFIR